MEWPRARQAKTRSGELDSLSERRSSRENNVRRRRHCAGRATQRSSEALLGRLTARVVAAFVRSFVRSLARSTMAFSFLFFSQSMVNLGIVHLFSVPVSE